MTEIPNVHAIPADFEAEHGRDVEATTAAAQASPRIESNVTAPAGARLPVDHVPEHGAIEYAVEDSSAVEIRSA